MTSLAPAQRVARRVLRISPAETTVERRGFRVVDPAVRDRLEAIGGAFLSGYHLALDIGSDDELAAALTERHDAFSRGFAYEGAGMALTFLDTLVPPRRRRFRGFAGGVARRHTYLVHVGRGWAAARLRRVAAAPRGLHPLLGPLALDGAGFHEAYFHPARALRGGERPRGAPRQLDQGIGRALWFVEGADADRIADRVAAFAPARRPDLWSGVGLAAAYAGGAGPTALRGLVHAAGADAAHLAQGAAFAAKARLLSDTVVPETELAVPILCGRPVADAAAVTDDAAAEVDLARSADAYDEWRGRVRRALVADPRKATA